MAEAVGETSSGIPYYVSQGLKVCAIHDDHLVDRRDRVDSRGRQRVGGDLRCIWCESPYPTRWAVMPDGGCCVWWPTRPTRKLAADTLKRFRAEDPDRFNGALVVAYQQTHDGIVAASSAGDVKEGDRLQMMASCDRHAWIWNRRKTAT